LDFITPPAPPVSLNPLQASVLGAIERYSHTQARPVTIRDVYRRLTLDKALTVQTVRELKDMGLLNVMRVTANNKLKVMTLSLSEGGQEWILN